MLAVSLMILPAGVAGSGRELVVFVPYDIPWFRAATERYAAETGINVTVETFATAESFSDKPTAGTEYLSAVSNRLLANPPDLVLALSLPIEISAPENSLVNLSSFMAENNGTLFYNIVDGMKYGMTTLHSVPLSFDAPALLVNTDLLKEAGIENSLEKLTLDEYSDYIEEFSEKSDFYAVGAEPYSREKTNGRPYELMREMTCRVNFAQRTTSLKNESFNFTLQAFERYYNVLRAAKTTGTDYMQFNRALLLSGKVMFQPLELSAALGYLTEYDFFEAATFPAADPELSGMFVTSAAISVVEGKNKQEATEFVKFLLEEEQQKTITTGIPVNRAAATDLIGSRNSERMVSRIESLENRAMFSRWNDLVIPVSGTAAPIYNAIAAGSADITAGEYDKFAKTLESDMNAFLGLLAPPVAEEAAGTVAALDSIVLGAVMVGLIALNGAMLFAFVRTVFLTYKEQGDILRGEDGKYGRQLKTVRASKLMPVAVAICSAGLICFVSVMLRHMEAGDSALRYHQSGDITQDFALFGILIAILALVIISSISTIFLSRVVFCERAIIVVNGRRHRVLYTDEIDVMIFRPTTCLIQPYRGKGVILQFRAYRGLQEAMQEYSKRSDLQERIRNEAATPPHPATKYDI